MTKGIEFKVKSYIYGYGRGWCFSQNDFSGCGNAVAVRKILSRLEKSGFIRRLSRGIYEYPRKHSKLGILPADLEQVVAAVARKDNLKFLASGAYAANLLGLSNQVPVKVLYLTEGLSRKIQIGKRDIIFKSSTPKNLATAGTFAGLLIQALKYLGKENITPSTILKLKKQVGKEEMRSLKKFQRYAPAWIQKIIFSLGEN